MISIARKNLFGEPVRFLIAAGGVAFATLLILIMVALYRGFLTRITSFFEKIPADLFVVQEGVRDMFHSPSLLPNRLLSKIEATEGVERADRFVYRIAPFEHDGKPLDAFLIGFDTERDFNGPPEMEEGKRVPERDEVVIDRVFAQRNDIKIGDTLTIAKRDFRVVGIAREAHLIFNQFFFIPIRDMEELFELEDFTNFFAVSLAAGTDPSDVIHRLQDDLPGTNVLTHKEFLENHKRELLTGFRPILTVLVAIGLAIAAAIVGLVIYNSTIEKSREYGILKALGMTNSRLYAVVLEQAILAGVAGFLTGIGLAAALIRILEVKVPEFVTALVTKDVALVGAALLFVSLFAAILPALRINRIDPALVFRS